MTEQHYVVLRGDLFNELAYLNPRTGEIRWLERPPGDNSVRVQGHVSRSIAAKVICFYRYEGYLRLRIDDVEYRFNGALELRLDHLSRQRNRVTICDQGKVVFQWEYVRPVDPVEIQRDPTPFIEEEDFDILLFAYNVLSNPRRRREIYPPGG
jgi:hypothetical protein